MSLRRRSSRPRERRQGNIQRSVEVVAANIIENALLDIIESFVRSPPRKPIPPEVSNLLDQMMNAFIQPRIESASTLDEVPCWSKQPSTLTQAPAGYASHFHHRILYDQAYADLYTLTTDPDTPVDNNNSSDEDLDEFGHSLMGRGDPFFRNAHILNMAFHYSRLPLNYSVTFTPPDEVLVANLLVRIICNGDRKALEELASMLSTSNNRLFDVEQLLRRCALHSGRSPWQA
ncbi:hypothetical protein AJ79_10148 [Helicocarpus griseus UAMH5409]|uniref:Uncharacterized protein n=1 Tax=Helicocarpus griseus UAMH5409 TaxID=1447875 RepID=A0A2B7WFA7_9EURO|nr:hypothetical protein AJ79_10148 [Helicocarpus griseus UAMH5409]